VDSERTVKQDVSASSTFAPDPLLDQTAFRFTMSSEGEAKGEARARVLYRTNITARTIGAINMKAPVNAVAATSSLVMVVFAKEKLVFLAVNLLLLLSSLLLDCKRHAWVFQVGGFLRLALL
jgi:hypothetical protein